MAPEKKLTLDLVAILAERFGPASKISQKVPAWLECWAEIECPERPKSRPAKNWWEQIRILIRKQAELAETTNDDIIRINIDRLATYFGLSDIETRIFRFLTSYKLVDAFKDVVDESILTGEVSFSFLLAQFCGSTEAEVRILLRPRAALRTLGIVKDDDDYRSSIDVAVSGRLGQAMQVDVESMDELIAQLFPPAPVPEAEWQDFAGLGAQADLMRDILTRALETGMQGVNILLYGPPGTGKTEFCKVLTKEVRAQLRAVGETDEYGLEPTRYDRQSELCLAGKLLAKRRDTVLMFDEMEDLLGSSDGGGHLMSPPRPRTGSKVHFNRMLETNPVPVLWTTNSIDDCDPAFLRRMTFSLEMRAPTGAVRSRIW